jgi:hypothetical protein
MLPALHAELGWTPSCKTPRVLTLAIIRWAIQVCKQCSFLRHFVSVTRVLHSSRSMLRGVLGYACRTSMYKTVQITPLLTRSQQPLAKAMTPAAA